jgi:hypothetical protein
MEKIMKSKTFLFFMLGSLSSSIYLEAGLGQSVDSSYLLADDSESDGLANIGELQHMLNMHEVDDGNLDILHAKINNSSVDEIVGIISECIKIREGLYLSYVIHYPSDEAMQAVTKKLDNNNIIDMFDLVKESGRHWEIWRIMMFLDKDDRRYEVRNMAPDHIKMYMDEAWLSINSDQWQQ